MFNYDFILGFICGSFVCTVVHAVLSKWLLSQYEFWRKEAMFLRRYVQTPEE